MGRPEKLVQQCRALGIAYSKKSRGSLPAKELKHRLAEARATARGPKASVADLVRKCKAKGIVFSNDGGVLPKDYLHVALTMPPQVASVRRTLHAAEIRSRTQRIVGVVRARGGRARAFDPALDSAQDVLSEQGRLEAWRTVAAVKQGGIVVLEPECAEWLQWTSAKHHKRKFGESGPGRARITGAGNTARKAVRISNRSACEMAPLAQFALNRGCLLVEEQSGLSLRHKFRPVQHIIQANGLRSDLVKGCRYGWPSGKPLRLNHNLPHFDKFLAKPCTHHGKHRSRLMSKTPSGSLTGTRAMRASAWYPLPFAKAVVSAAWGPTGLPC